MKKLLSILGTIGLTATSTTSLVACNKPKPNNNSENGGNNKSEPQEPPTNSNWKLVDNVFNIDTLNNDGKVYIGIFENKIENKPKWNIISWKNIIGEQKLWLHVYKSIYCWNGVNEPQTPEINNSGEIIVWKEQKD